MGGKAKRCCACLCNPKLTKVTLLLINFLLLIAGCVLTGVASWGVKYNSALHDAVPPSGVVPFIVAGVFLMVTALIGFIGGCFNHAKFGQWFLMIFAMVMLATLICEIIAASVLLTALGRLNTKWTADVNRDTVAKWINATWLDCCYNENGTLKTVYTCWTARQSSVVKPSTCQNGELFYDQFTAWLSDKLRPAAGVGLTLFLLQFIVIISACCAFCHGRGKFNYKRASNDEGDHTPFTDHEEDEDHDPEVARFSDKLSRRSHRSKPTPPHADPDEVNVSFPGAGEAQFGVGHDSDDDSSDGGNQRATAATSSRKRRIHRKKSKLADEGNGSDASI